VSGLYGSPKAVALEARRSIDPRDTYRQARGFPEIPIARRGVSPRYLSAREGFPRKPIAPRGVSQQTYRPARGFPDKPIAQRA
jgi:hypothetical protein